MSQTYVKTEKLRVMPRLPLEGKIDLTYRCNNNCRHCWLRLSPDAKEIKGELSFNQIKKIADEARGMGCRRWSISGGEPMLRPDFYEIFDFLTRNSTPFTINTNGTLITPKIAQLMRRKGNKMVALYGATKAVHDHVTRNPGSFEAVMRGFRYLKEAGAGFVVQIIPMKDNYHQLKDMVSLAESLSKHHRIGAAWLYLSACASPEMNQEIIRQRLPPQEVVELDKPDVTYDERMESEGGVDCHHTNDNGYLFSGCINARRDFHINPYGKMTFCSFIKDPGLLYDLKKGNFQEAWEEFIPSLATKIKITEEYRKNCGSCDLGTDCWCCSVYSYLEHRDFNKKVEYLCSVAKENRKFKENWKKNHRRYFQIAGITIQVESDLPIQENTFHPKFKFFEAKGPREDTVFIQHHFSLPDLEGQNLGYEVYRKSPWAIYRKNDSWVYCGISPIEKDKSLHRVAVFNEGHTRASIYNLDEEAYKKGNLHSLTMFPSDQILIARLLADREGLYLHSSGVNFNRKGLLFVGHSEAGKSTMATMLKGKAEILCDDRMIVRRHPEGFKIYGTWSHGDVPEVSGNSAPLTAILFLEKSQENMLIPIIDKKEISKRLLSCLIQPFVTADWWDKTLSLLEKISGRVPCYVLKFDKSGRAVELLKGL